MPEPWLRGTLGEVDAVRRQVLHALEQTGEDVTNWCSGLSSTEMAVRPFRLAPVGFHLRHIARSLDRLLTYCEGRQLSAEQMAALQSELEPGAVAADAVLTEVRAGLALAAERVRAISPGTYEEVRGVGRGMLPSTVGGLLVHCAEHTQRHAGQAVTTAKVVMGMRGGGSSESHPSPRARRMGHLHVGGGVKRATATARCVGLSAAVEMTRVGVG